MSKNVFSADNQQGSLRDPSETTRRAPLNKKEDEDIVHAL